MTPINKDIEIIKKCSDTAMKSMRQLLPLEIVMIYLGGIQFTGMPVLCVLCKSVSYLVNYLMVSKMNILISLGQRLKE